MSTEGILLNHSGSSSSSQHPTGGISTFKADNGLSFPTLAESTTFQVHNINYKPYFTLWNEDTQTVDFYELNSSNNELRKINSIYSIPKNQEYDIYLFSFKDIFYCCITPKKGSATSFLLYLDTSKNIWKNFKSQNLMEYGSITSAVEIENILYITMDISVYKTTDLINATEVRTEGRGAITFRVAKIANHLITFKINSNNYYIYIYQDSSTNYMTLKGNNITWEKKKYFFWNLPNEIYLLTGDSSIESESISRLYNFDFTKNTYGLTTLDRYINIKQFFFINVDDMFFIAYYYDYSTHRFSKQIKLSESQAFPFHQYLLKGNKIIVEDTNLIEIHSSNCFIKNEKIIEITEDGEVYLFLYRINNGRNQNFLIF